jgi:hypothetical protein
MRKFFRQLFCWHDWGEWDQGPGHAFRSRCVKGCGARKERL